MEAPREPRPRDLTVVEGPINQLDHGASQGLYGGKVAIDGTRKWPEEGYKRAWPEVARMTPAMDAQVEARWSELGLDAKWKHGSAGSPKTNGAHANQAGPGLTAITDSVLRAARSFLGRPS